MQVLRRGQELASARQGWRERVVFDGPGQGAHSMRKEHLLAVLLIVAFAFGGSFTCTSDDDDDDKHPPPSNPPSVVVS
jgi:hypothetical protein